MHINPDAPGNISQKGVASETDNETGFDPRSQGRTSPDTLQAEGSQNEQDGVDEDLGFDPESPDLSDPAVDPLHPARTSNDPVPSDKSSMADDKKL